VNNQRFRMNSMFFVLEAGLGVSMRAKEKGSPNFDEDDAAHCFPRLRRDG